MMAESGVTILDADKLGHLALMQPEIKQQIRSHWGDGVFDHNGEVNRTAVGSIVFGDHPEAKTELATLESITHPFIKKALADQIEHYRSIGTKVLLLDAPILIKAGWDQFCDEIVFVDSHDPIRQERATLRGWSIDHFRARENAQLALDLKRQRATAVIDNNDDLQHLKQQVDRLLDSWSRF